jgi:hypothetical protein
MTDIGRGRKPALPLELENSIVQSVKRASQLGVGVSRRQLLTRTGTLVKRLKLKTPFKNSTPGKDWWQKLKQRHSDLTIRKPEKTGMSRNISCSLLSYDFHRVMFERFACFVHVPN